MRVLLDQGVPFPISGRLAGHTIGISADLGWDRLKNGDLIAVAEEAGYEVLLTTGCEARPLSMRDYDDRD